MNVNVVIIAIMATIRIIGMSCYREEYVNMLSQSWFGSLSRSGPLLDRGQRYKIKLTGNSFGGRSTYLVSFLFGFIFLFHIPNITVARNQSSHNRKFKESLSTRNACAKYWSDIIAPWLCFLLKYFASFRRRLANMQEKYTAYLKQLKWKFLKRFKRL